MPDLPQLTFNDHQKWDGEQASDAETDCEMSPQADPRPNPLPERRRSGGWVAVGPFCVHVA